MARTDKPKKIDLVKTSIPKAIGTKVTPKAGSDLPTVELPNKEEDPIMDNGTTKPAPPPIKLKWWQSLSLRFFSGQIMKYVKSMLKVIFSLVGLYKRHPETGKIIYGTDGKPEKTSLGTFIASAIGFLMTTSYASYEVSGKTLLEWANEIFEGLF